MSQKPTIWITGLSASGKSTLANNIFNYFNSFYKIELLDAENVRNYLKNKYTHSLEDRYKVIDEIIKIANDVKHKDKIGIVASISHRKDMREKARSKLYPYFEIYLKTDLQTCMNRDKKGLYSKNINKEFIAGISEPYEEDNADLMIDVRFITSKEVFEKTINIVKKFLELNID